jgi:hypothetical protein
MTNEAQKLLEQLQKVKEDLIDNDMPEHAAIIIKAKQLIQRLSNADKKD